MEAVTKHSAHYTTELYREAFEYASGVNSDIKIFIGAMLAIMRDRMWETGWMDAVHHTLFTTPTLKEFIERPVPNGINTDIPWVYSVLNGAKELGDVDAEKAIGMLNKQIKCETGKSAEDWHQRKVYEAIPELPPAMSPGESGAKGGTGEGRSNGTPLGSNSREYTLGRLKRDFPELAGRVVSGELSANAAAIEAGFRKKPKPRLKTCPHCGGDLEDY